MADQRSTVDVAYLESTAVKMNRGKQRSYEMMHLASGQHVLDVGCGAGHDTLAMAQIVGTSGRVDGVDFDQGMIKAADQRAKEAGLDQFITHHHSDVTALPFEADTFDSCRSERVFQHLPEPDRALAEMVRVTKPGGWIVVSDADWSTVSFDSPEVEVGRQISRAICDLSSINGTSARQLYRLFRQNRLVDLDLDLGGIYFTSLAEARFITSLDQATQLALEHGLITEDQLGRWLSSVEQADAQGVFYGHMFGVMAAGRKPQS